MLTEAEVRVMSCEDGGKAASSGLPEPPEWKGEERDSALEPPEGPEESMGAPPQRLDLAPLLGASRSRHRRSRYRRLP